MECAEVVVGGHLRTGFMSTKFGILTCNTNRFTFTSDDKTVSQVVLFEEVESARYPGAAIVLNLRDGTRFQFTVGGMLTSFTGVGSIASRKTYRDKIRFAFEATREQ